MDNDSKYYYSPLPEPIPIAEQKWPEDVLPLVTTRTITFMHEPYIRDCIEGILMQKTTFPVEVLIHDDASTDKTAQIVQEYAAKFPKLIKAICQKENQYSKYGITPIREALNCLSIGSKYIALCEGDDYWTDPLKLQKQVEFLEGNPEYVLSHTECDIYYESSKIFKRKVNGYKAELLANKSSDQIFYDLINSVFLIRTASVIFRAQYVNITANDKKFKMGDTPLWLKLSQIGKFHYLEEPTVVYRVAGNSATQPGSKLKRLEFVYSSLQMRLYYLSIFKLGIPENIEKKLLETVFSLEIEKPGFLKLHREIKFNQLSIKYKLKFAILSNVLLRSVFVKYLQLLRS